MWVAHALTLLRIPLAVALWATYGDRRWSAALIALAIGSDAVDGWVARRIRPGGSALGAWLDPFADKLFVVGVLAAIVVHDEPAWWLVALIAARELILAPLAIAYRIALARRPAWRPDFRAGALGKLATVAQFVALGLLALHLPGAVIAAGLAAVAGLAAIGEYVGRAVRARTAGDRATRGGP